MRRIVFIGTGNIAAVHAEALAGLKEVTLAAVVDPVRNRAEAFAKKYGAEAVFTSLDEALAQGEFTAAHVLTPPATHFRITQQLLADGVAVLVEKPMAETLDECRGLSEMAAAGPVPLRVSQNYIYHPAHLRLKKALRQARIGPVRHASCRYVMPLRQLAARQFGHWMFDSARNLLLEQAIHPLSLLDDVAGPLRVASVWTGPLREHADGIAFASEWIVALEGDNGESAQLHVSLGASTPDWSLDVIGDDGRISVDYLANRVLESRPGAYIDVLEDLRAGVSRGAGQLGQSLAGAVRAMAGQAGLTARNDPFFQSIRNSVHDFHGALSRAGGVGPSLELDGARGARLVGLCHDIAEAGPVAAPRRQPPRHDAFQPDILLLGGTGFIGSYLTRDLVGEGKRVRVLARNTGNPARAFTHDNVELVAGSIADRDTLDAAMAGVPVVVNLAHGGGGDNWETVRRSMVGGAERVADAALASGVQKLLHVSSIAALYCGDAQEVITSETPPDASPERADYARAKAEAERLLMERAERDGLPVSIFRPGIVVGEGTSPFHSGVGFYNRERICLGWNDGTNPLPFVLVEDVAAALAKAAIDLAPEDIRGRAFNLVGDVRLTAREYTLALAEATGRPLVYRPQSLWHQQAGEVAKWLVKKAARRKVAFPSMRDLRSRGLVCAFDTQAEKTGLDWNPVGSRPVFIDRAIKTHAR